jgi:CheY-like chemotaxis protein
MEGDIWLESEAGVGSTFHFTVTLGKQHGNLSKRRSAASELGALRVLVVDDNSSSKEILCSILASFGLRVDQAASGVSALALLNQANDYDPYKLVLMDWKMPGMDGIETTRAIQENSNLTETPTVIMVTAFGREEALNAAEGVQIQGYLTKPVTPSSLFDSIMLTMGHELSSDNRASNRQQEVDDGIAKLQGAKILLVEDNEINQELAYELLTSNGLKVEVANDGQQALDRLAKEFFDGVLMDCQMPIMDGYSATRKLREQAQFKDLPILALTANAMVGDHDKAVAAGMNDHIAKPINVQDMLTKMAKWITPSNPIIVPEISAHIETVSINDFVNLPGIDTQAGLATAQGNSKLYRKLLVKFHDSELDFEKQFKAALQDDDPKAAERIAHTLKGVAGNIGAKRVQQAAKELEILCKEKVQQTVLTSSLDAVINELDIVIAGLAEIDQPRSPQKEAKVSIAPEKMKGLLDQLQGLLEEDDTESAAVLEEILALPNMENYRSQLKALSKAIDEYDFDEALLAFEAFSIACLLDQHES